MKSDIKNFKYLFQTEDDAGIRGKCACVQLIAIKKNDQIGLRKEKRKKISNYLGAISSFFDQFPQCLGQKKNPIYFKCVPLLEGK